MIDLSVGHPRIWDDYYQLSNWSYKSNLSSYPKENELLKSGLADIHKYIGNISNPKDYHVVIGNGASQILQAAIATEPSTYPTKVFAHSPYFPRFPLFTSYAGRANLLFGSPVGSDKFIEILTVPNNPDNAVYDPRRGSISQIYDCSYLWPQYGPYSDHQFTTVPDVIVFSLAKAMGLADLRIGWALVRNPSRAQQLRHHIEMQCGGVSAETQRIAEHFVHDELVKLRLGLPNCFSHGLNIMTDRWAQVKNILLNKKCVTLKNREGMFLWLRCEAGAAWLDAALGIKSAHGPAFGSDIYHSRINLACSNDEYKYLLDSLARLE